MRAVRHALAADVLVDGRGATLEHAALVVEDGRVVACDTQAELAPLLRDVPTQAFGAATILPGLIDAHVHVTFPADGRPYDEMTAERDEYLALLSIDNIAAHVAAGVTTMRDNGARGHATYAIRRFLDRNRALAPRLLVCGRPITSTGGHLHWCDETADGPDAIRRAVRRMATEGADHIKLVASGGGTAGTWPFRASYGEDELRIAVDAAHDHGLLTTAHCHSLDSVERALRAGVDCIEHASCLVAPPTAPIKVGVTWQGLEAKYDSRLGELIASSGAYIGSTLVGGYEALLAMRERAEAGELTGDELLRLTAADEHVQRKLDIFTAMVGDGLLGRLVVSTDAGPGDTRFGLLHRALELAVLGGVTPVQAIEAGTRVAAESCGIGDRTGALAPGLDADVLVVAGDAAADISALGHVLAVYRAGEALVGPSTAARVA